MTVRLATAKDIPTLNRLLEDVLTLHHKGRPDIFRGSGKKYTDEELLTLLGSKETPIFVACDDKDTVLGYAFCQFQRHQNHAVLNDVKTLYIDDLCVDSTCRGRGVGSVLFQHCKEFAKAEGCYNLTLNVWAKNETALRFYEKCGLAPQKIGMETIL